MLRKDCKIIVKLYDTFKTAKLSFFQEYLHSRTPGISIPEPSGAKERTRVCNRS